MKKVAILAIFGLNACTPIIGESDSEPTGDSPTTCHHQGDCKVEGEACLLDQSRYKADVSGDQCRNVEHDFFIVYGICGPAPMCGSSDPTTGGDESPTTNGGETAAETSGLGLTTTSTTLDPSTTSTGPGSSSGGSSTGTSGPPTICGDGNLDPDEPCDDGNADNADGCTAECQIATCGDGYVQAGVEVCDDGNKDNADGCTTTCVECDAENACGVGVCVEGSCECSTTEPAGPYCSCAFEIGCVKDWECNDSVCLPEVVPAVPVE